MVTVTVKAGSKKNVKVLSENLSNLGRLLKITTKRYQNSAADKMED